MEPTEATSILRRTPAVLSRLIEDVPPSWTHRDDGPGTWSAFDILAHLIEGERTDWIPRARIILEHGPSRPFDPFDRASIPTAPQTTELRLDEFARLRAENLAALEQMGLNEEDLARRGMHPELGEVTLEQLIATWVAHDLTHVAQVSEALARNYRDDVGPWRALLPALDRRSNPG